MIYNLNLKKSYLLLLTKESSLRLFSSLACSKPQREIFCTLCLALKENLIKNLVTAQLKEANLKHNAKNAIANWTLTSLFPLWSYLSFSFSSWLSFSMSCERVLNITQLSTKLVQSEATWNYIRKFKTFLQNIPSSTNTLISHQLLF